MQDKLSVTPLGSGQEVGRSCHVLEFRGIRVMLDIGIHPGFEGMNGLPFLDRVELDQIDVLLVTHFHLDHAASLPYLTEKTKFKGRIFMTHPTKAVLRLLLGDYLRLLQMKSSSGSTSSDDALYNEADLKSCMNKIELIDYHETRSVQGMSFHALNAGHVLGACMYWIEIGGRTVLYTGDYSMEEDRHLMAAEVPEQSPDLLIVEATYGQQVHQTRQEREGRFTTYVSDIVGRSGRCLIPVFALGRAQELLLILDEYWQANPQLQSIPIWYASKLASRALRVYQTYSNMMNLRIRAQMNASNPFRFKFIENLKSIDVNSFDDSVPSVVFASPGMLQSGVSRQLFDRWASDSKNGVVIAGYAVEHTLAKEIMSMPKEVMTLDGHTQPLKCSVEYVSFSAHVDFVQNRSFIEQVAPKHIVLVHGQKDQMGHLKAALTVWFNTFPEDQRASISMPPNEVEAGFKFPRRRSAKVMGSLAEHIPDKGESVQGVLVTHNFHSKIVAPHDLATYTPLHVGSITSKLKVPFVGSTETLRLFLNEMYSGIRESAEDDATIFRLHGSQVSVTTKKEENEVVVEWEASPAGDVVADSVIALIMHAQSSSASIRLTSQPCRHSRPASSENPSNNKKIKMETEDDDLVLSRLKMLYGVLRQQFQNVEAIYEGLNGTFDISTDIGLSGNAVEGKLVCSVRVVFTDASGADAKIVVESSDTMMASNVQETLQNAVRAAAAIDTMPS